MSRQYTLFPKLHIPPGSSVLVSARDSMTSSSNAQSQNTTEPNTRTPIFRAKRKHVLKACDRCRVKKTKCDGDQPCNRCATYNHPCLFGERRATQTKVYSRGFVEMLESHHALVVRALQQLYKHCINNEGFPGEPLDTVDGYPLTHAILDRLGLIKLGESGTNRLNEENTVESLDYWRHMSLSTDSNGIDDASPEPLSPAETTPSNFRDSSCFSPTAAIKCEPSTVSQNSHYRTFQGSPSAVPFDVSQNVPPATDFTHPRIGTGFPSQELISAVDVGQQYNDAISSTIPKHNDNGPPTSPFSIPRDSGALYSELEGIPGHVSGGAFEQEPNYEQHYVLDSNSPCYVWPYPPM